MEGRGGREVVKATWVVDGGESLPVSSNRGGIRKDLFLLFRYTTT